MKKHIRALALLLVLCLPIVSLPVLADTGVPPCPHEKTYDVEENRVGPSCTEAGTYELVTYCDGCHQELSRETNSFGMPAGHNPATPVEEVVEAATCTEGGYIEMVVYCQTCNAELERSEAIYVEPLEHDWDEGTATKEASCSQAGEMVYTCRRNSNHTRTSPIDKLEHTPGEQVREHEQPATCVEKGSYDSVIYCASCNQELSREAKEILATGIHVPAQPTRENVQPAACLSDGSCDLVVYCETCGAELSRERTTLQATGHTPILSLPVKAAIDRDGYRLHYVCRDCGLAGSSPDALTQERDDFIIPAHEHRAPARAAVSIAPTCVSAGESRRPERICEICGIVMEREMAIVFPALGHDMTYVPAVAPSGDGKEGRIAHYRCGRCGQLFYGIDGAETVTSMDTLSLRTKNSGSLETNPGVVEANLGRIVENTGFVEANYGTIENNAGTVERQFYNMTTRLDAGDYCVKYDKSFQHVRTGSGESHMFLEAGQSGVIALSAPLGSRITRVTYTLNGQELALEDLGDGRYRITAPDMPSGPDGFAFNESDLRVEIEEDASAPEGDSWKSSNLRTLQAQDKSINLLSILNRDASLNKVNRAIWVEGMDFDAASPEFRAALANRADIMNALADVAFGGGQGTMIFVLDNGARIVCDAQRVGQVINDMLPKVNYKTDTQQEEKQKKEEEQDQIEITLIFMYESERIKFEEAPPKAPEIKKIETPEPEPEDKKKNCLTPDTLILLADGTEKRVDQLLNADRLATWDFDTGCLTDAPMTFFHVAEEEAPVLRVTFSDGTSVGVVGEHVFFDLTDRQFVAISSAEQEAQLAGHRFAKLMNGQIGEVELIGIREDGVTQSYYSPVTEAHFNCFANGMLNISGFMQGLYNVFDLEETELKYDAEKKAADIEVVGELPYEIFEDLFPRELYERNDVGWLSVSVAKRMVHLRDLYALFEFCGPFFVESAP